MNNDSKLELSVTKKVLNPDFAQSGEFINHIPELFDMKDQGLLLDDRRNVVKAFSTQWGEWIVKSYKIPSLFQRFVYTYFRQTKAARAYCYSFRLRSMGLDVPKPVAFIELSKGRLFSRGFFIYEKCNDPFVYNRLVGVENFDKELAYAVAGFLAEIHAKGVKHGDLNLTNILYRREDGYYHFTIIDVNRCKFKKRLTKEDCYNDLRRVTHDHRLYDCIIAKYASLRGWSPEKAVARAEKSLNKFEAGESIKSVFKKIKSGQQS